MKILGKREKKWLEKYKLLKEYYEKNGNINLSVNYEINGIKLGLWLYSQKQAYKGKGTGVLTKKQIKLLNDLNIVWDVREEKWDEKYYLLEDYYKEHGNINVPRDYEINGVNLGVWLYNQKLAYYGKCKLKITEEQIELLNDLGINWNTRKENWNDNYKLLEEHYKKYGNIDLTHRYEINGVNLGSWLSNQRLNYKGIGTGVLTQTQIKLLNDLKIDWSPNNTKHLNSDITENNSKNYNKVLLERINHILEDLSNEGFNEIDSIEKQKEIEKIIIKRLWMFKDEKTPQISVNKHQQKWMEKYELLKEYYKEHGNIDVPHGYEINGIKLGAWLHSQKQTYKGKGTCVLTQYQIKLLNDLNMSWDSRDESWNKKYHLLEEYYKEYGNINISEDYEIDGINLGRWLKSLKRGYKGKGTYKLTQNQIELLNRLDINWDEEKLGWDEKYKLLKKYYEEHGNIDISNRHEINGVKIGTWLNTQRQVYKGNNNCVITKEQIIKLNKLNIDWCIKDTKFLNCSISKYNNEQYKSTLLERFKHILEDLSNEGFNEIDSLETQKEIEKIIIKRIWR